MLALSLSGCYKPVTRQEGTVNTSPTSPIAPPPKGMMLIPAGEFLRGSNTSTRDNEKPVHTIYVDAFYMDEREVTNAQYKAFLMENPFWEKESVDPFFTYKAYYLSDWKGNDYPIGKGNHPVRYVSWYAAMAYAKWAGKRLPTEAEWERAARGGLVGKKYPHGNTLTPRDANYGNNVKNTTAVGHYPANNYGLYDMAGNVREWCLDAYDRDFYSTFPRNDVARNPLSGANSVEWLVNNFTNVNSSRILRGGACSNTARYVRVANRSHNPPTRAFAVGFRCVRDVSP